MLMFNPNLHVRIGQSVHAQTLYGVAVIFLALAASF